MTGQVWQMSMAAPAEARLAGKNMSTGRPLQAAALIQSVVMMRPPSRLGSCGVCGRRRCRRGRRAGAGLAAWRRRATSRRGRRTGTGAHRGLRRRCRQRGGRRRAWHSGAWPAWGRRRRWRSRSCLVKGELAGGGDGGSAGGGGGLAVVRSVVVQVAALAHGLEVGVVAVLGGVVEVRDGEVDAGSGAVGGVILPVGAATVVAAAAALAFAFAAAGGAFEADAA